SRPARYASDNPPGVPSGELPNKKHGEHPRSRRGPRSSGLAVGARGGARMAETCLLEEAVEFAENQEPRCPCVLLLDTSGSMHGAAIAALNEGLRAFQKDLSNDSLASLRVEVAVVTFDSSVNVAQDFVTADRFQPPALPARGATHMGAAIHKALDMLGDRKATYRANGVAYYRPLVFLI